MKIWVSFEVYCCKLLKSKEMERDDDSNLCFFLHFKTQTPGGWLRTTIYLSGGCRCIFHGGMCRI